MAGAKPHFVATIVLLGLLAALNFAGAQIGVCYGSDGSGLPNPADVVALYTRNNIGRMRIYKPDQPTLQALRGSNIEVMLGVPNTDLQDLASSQANANNWVQNNVRNYDNVKFKYIAVGNEVMPGNPDTNQYVDFVLPAMRNIFTAISDAGLADRIKVSTAVGTALVKDSFPPSTGEFREDVKYYINPIIQFLANNGSPLLVTVYPYFAYTGNPGVISLDYALFRSGVDTPDGRYESLFAALVDTTYSAIEKALLVTDNSAVEKQGRSSVEIVVPESGWPSGGGGPGSEWPSAGENSASIDNARTYNQNLIRYVLGNEGTPKRPGRSIETYIFAMFDENQKRGPDIERHFGLFSPNGQPKYPIRFTP